MTGDDVKKDIIGTLGAADSAPQSHDSNDNMNTDVRAGRLPTLSRSERARARPLYILLTVSPNDRGANTDGAHIRARGDACLHSTPDTFVDSKPHTFARVYVPMFLTARQSGATGG